MLQDPNVERYVENAIKPLKKEIAKLKVQIEELNKALRIHDVSGQVCVHCGKGREMHTVASAMCLDRFKHFEQTKTIAFRCPLSKIDELKMIVKYKLSEWL